MVVVWVLRSWVRKWERLGEKVGENSGESVYGKCEECW
jgi:hypothetical protein